MPPTSRLAEAGLTDTVFTGGGGTGFTVITGVVTAGAASLVAVMVAVPAPAAVTVIVAPLDELTELAALTVKTAVLLETQLTVRPLSVAPPPSLGIAVSTCVSPTMIGVVGDDSATVTTGGGGAAVTVMELAPDIPSLVAVIVTGPPTLTAVTRPFASTVAIAGVPELHVIALPVSRLLLASLRVAVSCCVLPTTMLAELGATETVATGTGFTVISGVVALGAVSLVAVIVAVPRPTAVTVTVAPVDVLTELAALTVNTAVLLETQLTVRPLKVAPPASLGIAVSTCVAPTTTGVVGVERATVTTGGGGEAVTVMELAPCFPSLVAIISIGPCALRAVTKPLALTLATVIFSDAQVIVRPVSTFPAASLSVAVNCCVAPTTMLADVGVSVTVFTGAGGTALTVITGVVTAGAASLVAVIVAVPGPAAVTVTVAPLDVLTELAVLTVNTAVLLETQFTVRPLSALPPASLGVAVITCVAPTNIGVLGTESVTAATGTGLTVIELVPVFPSLVAVIVTGPPTLTAVTKPFASTLATAAAAEVQVMVRPVSGFPPTSISVATSC